MTDTDGTDTTNPPAGAIETLTFSLSAAVAQLDPLSAVIARLKDAGHIVERTDDFPVGSGLYRVNDGPELTAGQVISIAARLCGEG